MKKLPIRDYTGATIYLGIDVHKKTYAVTAIWDGQIVKCDTLKADPNILIAYCKKFFVNATIKSAYEAGFCGFHLHRTLEAAGFENLVVHAAGIEIAVSNRVKTDKRDSKKIAQHLYEGKLKGVHIPTVEREDQRTVTRLRETFVQERSRLSCQLKAILFQFGLIGADNKKKVSEKWINDLRKLKLNSGLKYSLNHYMDMWLHINSKIKEIDKELVAQSQNDISIETVYRSAPGIGPTSSRVLANELGNLKQFNNVRQLSNFIGITPCEYSSGEHIRQGNITRQGKPILRKILVQAAWRAITIDPELEEIFNRIAKKSGSKKAIVAVARKLICRIRACFINNELYVLENNKKVDCNEEMIDELVAISA